MKYILLILGVFIFAIQLNAKKNNYSKEVRAYIDSKNYYAPGYGNYIEFQIKFIGSSLNYVYNESGISAEVFIQMEIKKQFRLYLEIKTTSKKVLLHLNQISEAHLHLGQHQIKLTEYQLIK